MGWDLGVDGGAASWYSNSDTSVNICWTVQRVSLLVKIELREQRAPSEAAGCHAAGACSTGLFSQDNAPATNRFCAGASVFLVLPVASAPEPVLPCFSLAPHALLFGRCHHNFIARGYCNPRSLPAPLPHLILQAHNHRSNLPTHRYSQPTEVCHLAEVSVCRTSR